MRRDHYDEANAQRLERHPVDEAVARRLPHVQLRRQIRRCQRDVQATLTRAAGRSFLTLEELTTRRQADREQAYFNLGVEAGLVTGRQEALRALRGRGGPEHDTFVHRVKASLDVADVPAVLRVAALLEIAWSLALDAHELELANTSAPPSR